MTILRFILNMRRRYRYSAFTFFRSIVYICKRRRLRSTILSDNTFVIAAVNVVLP
jgi:hypothetical protein